LPCGTERPSRKPLNNLKPAINQVKENEEDNSKNYRTMENVEKLEKRGGSI